MSVSVPTLSSDLSHEEAILQIADTLDQLAHVTNSVFSRIRDRIEQQTKCLSQIDQRIRVADQKVQLLRNTKQSASFWASSKFPATDFHDYESPIGRGAVSVLELPPYTLKTVYHSRAPEPKEIKDKLHFYQVKPKLTEPSNGPANKPSRWLNSASSYLLFNTAENPFATAAFVNPLEGRAKSRNVPATVDSPTKLGQAPTSLQPGHRDVDDLLYKNFFKPDPADLPDFDLPDFLPDLPFIADNVSLPTGVPFTDVPAGADFSVLPPAPSLHQPEAKVAAGAAPSQLSSDAAATKSEKQDAPPPALDYIPPLSLPDILQADAVDHEKRAEEPGSSGEGNARASLMEAIRLAGGINKAGLKSVKEDPSVGVDRGATSSALPAGSSAGAGGGDLMSDLVNKLAMRRKGISGKQQPCENARPKFTTSLNPTMAKISSMIPPPPGADSQNEDEDEDGQDDEDDDWA